MLRVPGSRHVLMPSPIRERLAPFGNAARIPTLARSLLAAALLAASAVAAPSPPASATPSGPSPATDAPARTVVILLFDGWAPSMMDEAATPAMDRLRAEGAWTHRFEPVFPTLSFPNQVSISTGCWPASHGIVSNVFLDPARGRFDRSIDADWMTGCEHLHEVAERQGVRAAALGWIGRFSGTRGNLATEIPAERAWKDYPDDAGRAAQVVTLLERNAAGRPGLIAAYFRGPNRVAHDTGMHSPATRAAVEASDRTVGRIVEAIDSLPDHDGVALLVLTDHGMAPVSKGLDLGHALARRGIEAEVIVSGTTGFLYLDDRVADDAARALAGEEAYDVVRKGAHPESWHLGDGPRVPEIILTVRPPWFIEDVLPRPWWVRWLGAWVPGRRSTTPAPLAEHGYPPDVPDMRGIFYARGAGIAAGREIEGLRAIDVHPLAAHLLGISPGTPVDGRIPEGALAARPGDPAPGAP